MTFSINCEVDVSQEQLIEWRNARKSGVDWKLKVIGLLDDKMKMHDFEYVMKDAFVLNNWNKTGLSVLRDEWENEGHIAG